MNQDLLLTLIGLGVLLIIGIAIVVVSIKKTGDKKEAREFLEGLAEQLKDVMLDVISKINIKDLSDITNIEKIEADILQKVYDAAWNYIQKVVENNADDNKDFFTKAILALLNNREFVESFIKELVNGNIANIIWSKSRTILYDTAQGKLDESEAEDEKLQEEFSDKDKYIEEVTDEDQTHGEAKEEPTEEELAKLNPQVDEPEELDPENDSSVEVVDVDDEIYYDKSGRPRSKVTGKWVKVDK